MKRLFSAISERFALPTLPWKLNRLTQLLLLAGTVLVYSVMGMAVANSLFVSQVGAGQLPIAFILIGLCSMPIYALFSQIVDRFGRAKLFRYVLVGSMLLAIALRFLLTLDATPVYYVLLIFIFFQWDFHNNVLYPSLLTDYFTTLEYKRYAPFVGIAQAGGTLLGGGITAILTQWISTRNLLLCLPLTFAIAILQLIYLERSQRPVVAATVPEKVSLIESITSFPGLAKRYPLALLLASSSFLLVIIYISSEFLWFNIYGQSFTERELTSFLGLMRIVISVIQVVMIYGLTRPLLQSVGVARMNTVYPLTTFASLVGLAFNVNLPAAIALHVNGDALYKAINLPVHQLNYNAIPKEFIGRIRALSDGFIYSIGLTLAGVVLWICHHLLSLSQITWIAAGLTILLFLVRFPMGRFYGDGLEAMIRSNAIDLNNFSDNVSLPTQSAPAIQELLASGDERLQRQGLKLAASYDSPSDFLADLEPLVLQGVGSQGPEGEMAQGTGEVYQGVMHLFIHSEDPILLDHCTQWLSSTDPQLNAFALEVCVATNYDLTTTQLQSFCRHPHPRLKFLGQLMVSIQENEAEGRKTNEETTHAEAYSGEVNSGEMNAGEVNSEEMNAGERHEDIHAGGTNASSAIAEDTSAIASLLLETADNIHTLTRVIAHRQDPALLPLIHLALSHADSGLTQTILTALLPLAPIAAKEVAGIALSQTIHDEPTVRVAAFKLLGKTRCPDYMDHIADGYGDRTPQVRHEAALALANYGKAGVTLAQQSLASNDGARVKSAIATIGQVRTKYASDILYDAFIPQRQLLTKTRQWQEQIPQDDVSWQPLAIAIEDYHQRQIDHVLHILSCLGHGRTVNTVQQILATTNHQDTENAIEVLASLSHRRFIAPILPLLEQRGKPTRSAERSGRSPSPSREEPTPSPSQEGNRHVGWVDDRKPNSKDDELRLRSQPSNAPTPQPPNQNTKPVLSVPNASKIQASARSATNPKWLRDTGYTILLEALETSDRWIKTGAMIALAQVPSVLMHDSDPFVQSIASQMFAQAPPDQSQSPSTAFSASPLPIIPNAMNRILLLKNVAIFKNLSLDELLLIDQALEQEHVLSGQTIYEEGNWGSHFYIVAAGQVRLVKTIADQLQEIRTVTAEQYFGEIALFDDAPRWDGAIALEDCTLLKLEKTRFISLISQRPHIILEACRFLSQRLRETDSYAQRTEISQPKASSQML